jgi:phosphoribosyl 1,2-cyclic phosphate phosphodiesterase
MSEALLTLTILGSGTSTGVPVIGCSCPVCLSTLPENSRTRCSALVSWGGKNVLLDTSTDLRLQMLREGVCAIDAVLYTHTHADHVHGIDDLRAFNLTGGEAIPIFGSRETIAVIRRNFGYIFEADVEPGYRPRLVTRDVAAPFELFGETVRPLPLRHGGTWCLGYRIGPFAYLTDCSAIPPETERSLQGLEVLVIDALRFRPHTTHFNIPQALEVAGRLGARRTLLTHLSHEVEHRRDSAILPAGVEFAYDGQQLALNLGASAATP